MCQNQVLSALSPANKWDSGGPTTPLGVVKIRIKTKNKSYYIHLSVQNGKQPRVQCSQTDERCNCPDLGWWVFSTLLLCFLREGFSSLPQARSPGHGAAAAAESSKAKPTTGAAPPKLPASQKGLIWPCVF